MSLAAAVTDPGAWIMAEADRLAAFSEEPGRLTRRYLTAEHRTAGEHIAGLMRAAGMTAAFDDLGNVVGRLEGRDRRAAPILVGSHMDSVVDAGRYDGPLGVLAGIAAVARLTSAGARPARPIEVIAFGDEEGARFGVTMIGSRALVGRFEPAWLDIRDDKGVTMREALAEFGGRRDRIASLDRRQGPPAAYVEVHIEQGPVLEAEGLPVGVVTAIAGASRVRCRVIGLAGHAGTVPMARRRDALVAASAMVGEIAAIAGAIDGLVATVGRLEARPGAVNVIPGEVEFTIDIRHGADDVRKAGVERILARLGAIAEASRVALETAIFYVQAAARCDAGLVERLSAAIGAEGVPVRRLASGAGHDAMELARITPMAMLFVRSLNGGISHHPDESISASDAAVAVRVLERVLGALAAC